MMGTQETADIRVWDPFVRITHWTIAVGFFVAYFTEDEALTLHVWAGYTIGVLVALRVLWGVMGPRYARFADFVYAPPTVVTYLVDLLRARAKRYVGHSPAGGAMVVTLLLALAATVVTGLLVYAEEEQAGPLAGFVAEAPVPMMAAPAIASARADEESDETTGARRAGKRESAFEEAHEVIANLTLVLVIAHILGVILASIVHRENLLRAMVTGRKRADGVDELPNVRP
jgi:cytochrome b